MAKVKILIPGYTSAKTNGRSCSTVSLVQDKDINMVVDPGTLASQDLMKIALEQENLSIEDINIVCITHSHMDHYRNIGMFTKAKSLDYHGWFKGDYWSPCDGKVSDDIKIIKTPGHSDDSISLVVRSEIGEELGSIEINTVICGDVFWEKDSPIKDSYANNEEALHKSREKILAIADYIIPGHGEMYQNYETK